MAFVPSTGTIHHHHHHHQTHVFRNFSTCSPKCQSIQLNCTAGSICKLLFPPYLLPPPFSPNFSVMRPCSVVLHNLCDAPTQAPSTLLFNFWLGDFHALFTLFLYCCCYSNYAIMTQIRPSNTTFEYGLGHGHAWFTKSVHGFRNFVFCLLPTSMPNTVA